MKSEKKILRIVSLLFILNVSISALLYCEYLYLNKKIAQVKSELIQSESSSKNNV
ncbi:hypothetical protein HON22_00875, partial [Candidatus Peregrinibacteria bacterium]|nr:hypothetical protein [Candidatus Peregrinibacteria bacterium]